MNCWSIVSRLPRHRGNYPKALANYERGLLDPNATSNSYSNDVQHKNQCLAGIARTSIRCGDSRRGVSIAMDNDSNRSLRRECAEILEAMKVSFYKFSFLLLQDYMSILYECIIIMSHTYYIRTHIHIYIYSKSTKLPCSTRKRIISTRRLPHISNWRTGIKSDNSCLRYLRQR